jgi:anti-sigma B factor antagonist
MPLVGLRIVVNQRGTTVSIELEGECDLAAREAMHDTINAVLARDPGCVVLDLSRLSFIDSSGIHLVVELAQRSKPRRIHLVIFPGPRAVQRPFELCGLGQRLPFIGAA